MTVQDRERNQSGEEFADLAQRRRSGLFREYLGFTRHTGKWWLLPIFAMLGLIGALIVLGGSGAAPFLYALF
jgi:hypothetical protein